MRKGQSLAHICYAHSEEIPVSRRTLYRYVTDGVLSAKVYNLPRRNFIKKRKKRGEKRVSAVVKAFLEGRRYSDFKRYIAENPTVRVVQADTVIGRIGGKALLTLHFVDCSLMLGFLLERNTIAEVKKAFGLLKERLNGIAFSEIFPVILTDNGKEFNELVDLETDENGEIQTQAFYCDPYRSTQKAEIENNHVLVRRILTKGMSFDKLEQGEIDRVMTHINAQKRAQYEGKSPREKFVEEYGEEVAKRLKIEKVEADEIMLKPELIKQRT